ncbi:nuclear transport factor 2 family protein [Erythrobacter sp. SG61-1L]|uniref:nuclear transport factor 2 family protein n=1 Tax=Erythrobacter sp. SG61-1L TaxID=1603897 RepID=UPI0006C900E3|nr:nuclear transport factor 2 family protein [Erythrobacter sp. SG61-1L]
MRGLKPLRALVLATAALAATTPALAQNQSPEARLAAYRERVERLEDQDAVENLQADYGYYFDKGLWDDVADLFSKDGSFEYGQRGVYIGRERIRRALLLFGPNGLAPAHLNNHMQLQSVIVVAKDGKSATGRWQGMVMLGEPGRNGVWGVGIYENRYVKEAGVWKISSLHFYPTALTDYDLGFMKSALPMEGMSALFPPDRPPTEIYRTLPGNYIPPFSFAHPVTGKSLKDLPQPPDDVVGRK